jgi:hypothetical protein
MRCSRIFPSLAVLTALVVGGCNVLNRQKQVAQAKPPPTTSPATIAEAGQLEEMLTYIASDELEGRGLMTVGINRAADYIADHFKSAGLEPLPALDGYFQPFTVNVGTTLGTENTLELAGETLSLREDYMPLGLSGSREFSGPVAFVGYSISSAKYNYDDYAGIDVKGKVALAVRYEPEDDKGKSFWTPGSVSPEASFASKAKAAEEHGAVALLICNSEGPMDRVPTILRSAGTSDVSIPVIQITRAAAEQLLRQAGAKSLDTLQKQIDQGPKPHSFVLGDGVTASGRVDIHRELRAVKNVVAYLPGKGAHRNEFIVVGAHYDHVGRGEQGAIGRSRDVYNGADDNGSGTVAVMQLARKIAAGGARDRSIIFITFSGEERGLLGSQFFVSHPPVPISMIVAMLNLDMVGRMKNNVLLLAGAGTAAQFDSIVEKADAKLPLVLKTADGTLGARGGMGPSDHESFALKKIPVLFLTSGMHADYHRPSDDVQKINFVGLAQTVDLSVNLINRLVKMPRARYVDKYDHSFGIGNVGITSNVQLGIMPDYAGDQSQPGVRVAGTMPDTAAAAAGIKEGDVIVGLAGDVIKSLGDYMTTLSKHKAGDKIKVDIIRDKQKIQLEATLRERKG